MMNNLLLPSEWLQALGWALTHSLWQFAIVALGGAALLRAARHRLSKASQYAIACGLLMGCGLLFAATAYTCFVPYTAPDTSWPIAGQSHQTLAQQASQAQPPSTEFIRVWKYRLTPYFPSLAFSWLIGLLLLSARQVGRWLFLGRLRQEGVQALSAHWNAKWEALKARMKITKEVRLMRSAIIGGLSTFGHFKPIVLAPIGLLAQLSEAEAEALLLHELAHIRRHDYLHNLLLGLLETLFFFHPGVWWLAHQVKRLREECCDELVCSSGTDSLVYAEALLVAARYTSSPKTSLAMNANAHFSERIAQLLHPQATTAKRNHPAPAWLSAMLLLSTTLLLLNTVNLQAQPSVSLAAGHFKVLYVGVDNPITLAVSGLPNDKVKVTAPDGVLLTQTAPGKYTAKPQRAGVVDFVIEAPGLPNQQLMRFQAIDMPVPIATVGGMVGGAMSAEQFKAIQQLELTSETGEKVPCQITGYEVVAVAKGKDPRGITAHSAVFPKNLEFIKAILDTEAVIYFDDLKCLCPGDEEPRPINNIVLRIRD